MALSVANRIRVLLIDHHALVRDGLRAFLESQQGLLVVGEADNAVDALVLTGSAQPDIILLEPDARDPQSLDIIPRLLFTTSTTKIILVTGLDDPEMHSRAIRLGAMGVILKEQPADVLIKAIRKVYDGEAWVSRNLMASVLTDIGRGRTVQNVNPEAVKIATLTQREREVIALLGQGLKPDHIAARLSISEVTVRHHVASILSKLGIADRMDLLIYAYRHGLADLPH
ncbi:MAG: response regulator transcription factor [Chloroflexi bacterium]|nr:response regulator transcription factor [Chloroflexota bacterium]